MGGAYWGESEDLRVCSSCENAAEGAVGLGGRGKRPPLIGRAEGETAGDCALAVGDFVGLRRGQTWRRSLKSLTLDVARH